MKIALIISTLGCGGAESIVARISAYWARRGREVTIVCLGKAGDFRSPDDGVRMVELDMARPRRGFLDALLVNVARAGRLRRELARIDPDVVVSFMDTTNVTTLLAVSGTGRRVIVSERSVPREKPLAAPWRALRWLLYPFADVVAVQSRAAARGMRGRVAIVPNSVEAAAPADPASADGSLIVSIGRLSEEKGFDLLIRSLALVKQREGSARLAIWGEGEARRSLTELAGSLGMHDSVSLPGLTSDPGTCLARAGVFALSSRYEGFPNALCEAMAAGVPVVAFDCPGAVREIVRHGTDGLLVENGAVEPLAEALGRLLRDPAERRRLGARAREISERFSEERVMALWEGLLRPVKHG